MTTRSSLSSATTLIPSCLSQPLATMEVPLAAFLIGTWWYDLFIHLKIFIGCNFLGCSQDFKCSTLEKHRAHIEGNREHSNHGLSFHDIDQPSGPHDQPI